jgi:ABC-type uncharacterized transport system auxiliary subunit
MQRYKRVLILFISLAFILIACLNLKQPSNTIEYYTLEYDPPLMGNRRPLSCVIKLKLFSVSPIYNTNRMIYRDRSFNRKAYVYHRWRANPGDVVTYFLRRDMNRSGLFKATLSHDSSFPSSYMLEGMVDEFLELDGEDGWEAILSVSITFMAENEPDISNKILLQKAYRANIPCRQKNPRALAQAMSLAMADISESIIKDIHDRLDDHK